MKNVRVNGILAVVLIALLGPLGPSCYGQTSGASLLSAARKRASEAKGLDKEARIAVYEDVLLLLKKVPTDFPDEKPAVAKAHLETGRYLRRLKRVDQAEAAFRKVLDMPTQAAPVCDAIHDLASLLTRKKKSKEAEALLKRLVAEYPEQGYDRARALLRLGSINRKNRRMEEAESVLRQVLADHGDLWRQSIDAVDDLVTLKMIMGQIEEAEKILELHDMAIRKRFLGTKYEARVAKALDGLPARARLMSVKG